MNARPGQLHAAATCRAATSPAGAARAPRRRNVSGWLAVAAYSGSASMPATTRQVGPHEVWSGWENRRRNTAAAQVGTSGSAIGGLVLREPGISAYASSGVTGRQPLATASSTTRRWSRISASPRRTSTSGGLRRSRRSRVSRRQKVTIGCWRTQYAAGQQPGVARSAGRPPGRRCPRRRTAGARRGRASASRSGRPWRCRRSAPRRGPRGTAGRASRSRPRAARSRGGPSRPGRRCAPCAMTGQRRVGAVLVEVVEPQHRQPEPFGEPGLAGPGRAGQDDHPGAHGSFSTRGGCVPNRWFRDSASAPSSTTEPRWLRRAAGGPSRDQCFRRRSGARRSWSRGTPSSRRGPGPRTSRARRPGRGVPA